MCGCDIGKNLQYNFLLILEFLGNFQNFRFKDFISLNLGEFNAFKFTLVANPCDARDNFYNLAQSILWLKAYYNFFLTHNSTEC